MTTPISRRQKIITEFFSVFTKLTKLYGHRTNLGSNVFEWKSTPFQETDLPGISIRDTGEEVVVRGLQHVYTMSLELEARVSASTSTAMAREVIADIMTVIGQNCTLDGLIVNITPVSNSLLDFEQANKKFGTISMEFTVQYITDKFKPYC